jgi:uncharacterized membrane protein YkoI
MNRDIKSTIFTIAATVLAVGMLLTAFNSEVLGQISNSSSKNTTVAAKPSTAGSPKQGNLPNALPSITGSIPLGSTISGAISSKVKTTLSEAITTAQKTVGSNSSATLAFIRPLNGYLVYDIHVRNNSNNARYAVIVDPGNGKVLYKQALPSSLSTGDHTSMFGKDRRGSFSGGYGLGCGGQSHWSNSGFINNGSAGNFAGRVMYMSVPVSIDLSNNDGIII